MILHLQFSIDNAGICENPSHEDIESGRDMSQKYLRIQVEILEKVGIVEKFHKKGITIFIY